MHCSICGTKAQIPKWHQDYDRLRSSTGHSPYICEQCTARLTSEARRAQQEQKPV